MNGVLARAMILVTLTCATEATAQGRDSAALTLSPSDKQFGSEDVDHDWAPSMEAMLWGVFSAATEGAANLAQVECRTTICKVSIERTGLFLELSKTEIVAYHAREMTLVRESLLPLLIGTNPQLRLERNGALFSESPTVTYWFFRGGDLEHEQNE